MRISDWSSDVCSSDLLVEYDIPRGCLAAYYPETNALVPLSSFADHARTPTSKSIPVVVTAHDDSDNVPGEAPRDIPLAVEGRAGSRRGRGPDLRATGGAGAGAGRHLAAATVQAPGLGIGRAHV